MLQAPKIYHLKVAIFTNLLNGCWLLIPDKTTTWYKLYKIYAWTLLSAALCFIICSYIEIIYEGFYKFDFIVIANNFTSVTVYTIGMVRVWSLRGEKVENLLREIWNKEQQIYESKDEEIIKIYNEIARKNVKLNYIYWVSQIVDSATYLFIVFPIFSPTDVYYDTKTNETFYEKRMPLDPWTPFNQHKHHVSAYLFQEIGCCLCLLCNYGTDVMFYSLISYPIGQFNILKHILNNFDAYSEKIREQLNCTEDKADFVTMQLCVIEHQRIIRYINNYNEEMRNVMLFDFIQSSYQLAVLTITLMYENFTMARVAAGGYVVIMLLRVAVYYYYGNEVMTNGYETADNVYDVHWYNKIQPVKTMVKIFIMRCNKQTGLQIGLLTTMTWNIFFGIMKGAYSFITFLLQH